MRRSSGGGSSGCGNGSAVAALTEIPAPCRSLAQILIACKRSDTHSHSPTALDTHQAGPEGRREGGEKGTGHRDAASWEWGLIGKEHWWQEHLRGDMKGDNLQPKELKGRNKNGAKKREH